MKILVVEDDSRVAAFINRGLLEAGHVVDVAGDAEDGLSHVYISQYDVIVIDTVGVGYPRWDGNIHRTDAACVARAV